MNKNEPPTFETIIDRLDPEQLRMALHDLSVIVAHLVAANGGSIRLDRFPLPEVSRGWVAVRHGGDGSLTLTYCATTVEVEALTGVSDIVSAIDATRRPRRH